MGVLILFLVAVAGAQTFTFEVERVRLQRNETGKLEIDGSGVHYRSANGKTALDVPFADIHEADLSDSRQIRIETYERLKRELGGRREHVFKLLGDPYDDRLKQFLRARLERSLLAAVISGTPPIFSADAYHRHRAGGCPGRFEIAEDGLRFTSENAKHSRTWRWRDLESIGQADSLSFRITSPSETYHLELKQRLTGGAYDFAWRKLYDLPAGGPGTGRD
ncbi:MAG: hypothetical protein HYS04_00105 [Acidobacteria bacterium]|nr:hypothetical protein [Acidobacteriota bacterium]